MTMASKSKTENFTAWSSTKAKLSFSAASAVQLKAPLKLPKGNKKMFRCEMLDAQ